MAIRLIDSKLTQKLIKTSFTRVHLIPEMPLYQQFNVR